MHKIGQAYPSGASHSDLEQVSPIPPAVDPPAVQHATGAHDAATASLNAARMLFAAPQQHRTLQRVVSIASSAASSQKDPEKEEAEKEKNEEVQERRVFN